MKYHGKFGHTLGQIQHIYIISRLNFATHPSTWEPKLWHLLFLVSKVSRAAFNIWIIILMNSYFIFLIIIMDQISSDLHEEGIKQNTTQPIIVQNDINMRFMIDFLTEDGQFQALFILFSALLPTGKYRFNHMQPLTPLIYKLHTCTRL